MEKPHIFIISEVEDLISKYIKELDNLIGIKTSSQAQIKAFYLYGYAVFENCLISVCKRILQAFPERLKDEKSCSDINISQFSTDFMSYSQIGLLIDHIVEKLSYHFTVGKIEEVLNHICKLLSISRNSLPNDDQLSEVKDLRNDLAHNKILSINIDIDEALNNLKKLKELLICLKNVMLKCYEKYTSENLRRESWKYVMGSSPLLSYKDCWIIDSNTNTTECINCDGIKNFYQNLSSSEKCMLMLYLSNYSSGLLNYIGCKASDVMPIVKISPERYAYIVELFTRYKLLLQYPSLYYDSISESSSL